MYRGESFQHSRTMHITRITTCGDANQCRATNIEIDTIDEVYICDDFGKRTTNCNRRSNDCIVLEPSEMLVIDYPDMHNVTMNASSAAQSFTSFSAACNDPQRRRAVASMNLDPFMLPPTSSSCGASVALHRTLPSQPSTFLGGGGVSAAAAASRLCVDAIDRRPPSPSSSSSVTSSSGGGSTAVVRLPTSSLLCSRQSFVRRHSSTSTASSGGPAATDRRSTSSNRQPHAECDDELADLPEANVDSDEEDDESCPSGDSFVELRDGVRECLEKEPADRSDDDLLTLLDFMQHMPAFATLPVGVKRELCVKMVFAVVDKAFTTVMRHGEQLDSWSVIVNGEVEVIMPDGSRLEFHMGDSFGVEAHPGTQFQCGQMQTLVDDCQFVLVAQADYVQTMARASDNLRKHTDAAGEIISETERRTLENNREGYVLIKGKPEKLTQALIEERDTNVDQYYVEDFLLMHRTFVKNPTEIFQKFLLWFNGEPYLREKVARLVLLWVNNHFNDFESDALMTNMLEQFEQALERENMMNHQQLLNIACSVKSRSRVLVYKRSNREENLHFSILGGNNFNETLPQQQANNGIFVSKVERNSQAEKIGLKRGDQILEVNNANFLSISFQKALEILRSSTHLSITVKANLLGFKEMLSGGDCAPSGCPNGQKFLHPKQPLFGTDGSSTVNLPRTKSYGCAVVDPLAVCGSGRAKSAHARAGPHLPATLHHTHSSLDARQIQAAATVAGSNARSSVPGSPLAKQQRPTDPTGPTGRLSKLIKKIKHGNSASSLPLEDDRPDCAVNYHPAALPSGHGGVAPDDQETFNSCRLKLSRSNPDLTNQLPPLQSHTHNNQNSAGYAISKYYQPTRPLGPEHVLKVYKADQTYKYLAVHKDTSAHTVVQLALQEFGLAPPGSESALDPANLSTFGEWSLCEVIVSNEGFIKQRRLPDQMQNLAERIALNSRYYLKNNKTTEALVPDGLAPELLKESQTTLIELNANILAAQLTLQDFSLFASIESTEYVDNLFQNKGSKYGWPKLEQFEQLVNKEMWWVATEVCRERNLIRRAKIIKKFIKVARQCRDFKNFNSMFAVVSGLEKPCVRRLHSTWDKISTKYTKIFDDLQLLLDPSRNMSKYRQHLAQMSADPPAIPLFPVVRKDLYFIHECNATLSDGLVNFEKLRMIAKEIRAVVKLASAPYELSSMSEHSGGFGSSRINDALLYMNSFEGGAAIATMRKQFMQRGPFSRKKLYEQALMVRRVKSYLAGLSVIDVENDLDKLSFECESQPNSTLNLGGPSLNRRRLPSPSPSSVSSASSDVNKRILHPKFGVESPQAVQRMLALVDHSRLLKPSGGGSVAPSAPCYPHQPHHHHFHYGRSSSPPAAVVSPNIFRRKAAPATLRNSLASGHGRSQSESTHQFCGAGNSKDGCSSPQQPTHGNFHRLNNNCYGQQATLAALHPVDLTAESSCVNILISPLRMHSSGSVTSTDSALSQHSVLTACAPSSSSASCGGGGASVLPSTSCGRCFCHHGVASGGSSQLIVHAVSCDSTDSGHCSIGDAALSSAPTPSMVGVGSPPSQRRSYPLNSQLKDVGSGGSSGCTCGRQKSPPPTRRLPHGDVDRVDVSLAASTAAATFAECQQQTMRRANSVTNNNGGSRPPSQAEDYDFFVS